MRKLNLRGVHNTHERQDWDCFKGGDTLCSLYLLPYLFSTQMFDCSGLMTAL